MASIRDDDSEFERDLALLQRAGALLDQAMGVPPGDREAFVRKHAGEDAALRDAALALLREGSAEVPQTGAPGGALSRAKSHGSRVEADLQRGDRVGPFVVLDTIGHGGMGSVYLAEQKEPVRRRVALKVIKLGMDTKAVLARFEAERQALALMDHSHIAKVLEAGVTANGKPYFAMEYVKGMPITRYCDDNKLSLEDRLALFRQVCSGVQHAHTKGVIHRDLTPNNVLVTLQDGKPAAKIIDFGLARATDHRLTEKTLFTEQGVILGTPEYMSPEQAGLDALDIDMRSDVYTLGALLYELLAGKPPFDGKSLRAQGYEGMCRTIRSTEPPRPSTSLTTQAGGTDAAAKLRRTDAGTLLRRLRGDLDWIVLKCLEKDRTRRYETVSQLADDVERYLDNEPVLARAPSAAYRFVKFARRYRGQLAAAALVLLVLVCGLAGSLYFWRRAEDQAAEALARTREFDQLAVIVRLDDVQAELKALNGPWQDCGAAERWLEKCDAVLAMRGEVQETLSGLRAPPPSATPAQIEAQEFLRRALTNVMQRLDDFAGTKRRAVDERLRCARLTTNHPGARATWQEAAAAILAADGKSASELYKVHPIDLQPHLGLVPIGKNPKTLLWEFYHLRSAWDPTKVADPADVKIPEHDAEGNIAVGDDTGIVLVLLPGGTFMMGAQRKDKNAPNYDALAEPDEGPPHRVKLSPFFLGRHETTKGQYRRLGGTVLDTLRHRYPVNSVSRSDGDSVCSSQGLTFPTEAQWEYGCRAGTTTPWWTGKTSKGLHAELGELRPVGSGQRNEFGLHETIGGVIEWCLDEVDLSNLSATYQDDVMDPCARGGSRRVIRGGCWSYSAQFCRSAFRNSSEPANAFNFLGFRPALAARSDVK